MAKTSFSINGKKKKIVRVKPYTRKGKRVKGHGRSTPN